jgi:hypothetical protein
MLLNQSHDAGHSHGVSNVRCDNSYVDAVRASHGQLPKINFPIFNGDNPQL